MATKMFCDRCGTEITKVKSGSISGVADADEEGNGSITDSADLCRRCYRAVVSFMKRRRG